MIRRREGRAPAGRPYRPPAPLRARRLKRFPWYPSGPTWRRAPQRSRSRTDGARTHAPAEAAAALTRLEEILALASGRAPSWPVLPGSEKSLLRDNARSSIPKQVPEDAPAKPRATVVLSSGPGVTCCGGFYFPWLLLRSYHQAKTMALSSSSASPY